MFCVYFGFLKTISSSQALRLCFRLSICTLYVFPTRSTGTGKASTQEEASEAGPRGFWYDSYIIYIYINLSAIACEAIPKKPASPPPEKPAPDSAVYWPCMLWMWSLFVGSWKFEMPAGQHKGVLGQEGLPFVAHLHHQQRMIII